MTRVVGRFLTKQDDEGSVTEAIFVVGEHEMLIDTYLHFHIYWENPYWMGDVSRYDKKRGRFHNHQIKIFPQPFSDVMRWIIEDGYKKYVHMDEGGAWFDRR